MRFAFLTSILVLALVPFAAAQSAFRVTPYVQNPSLDGMSVFWFSRQDIAGELVFGDDLGPIDTLISDPSEASALDYPAWQVKPGETAPDPPFRHSIRLSNLIGNKEYWYRVTQGNETFESEFRTAPGIRDEIRFVVYGDSETEPDPLNPAPLWADPADPDSERRYLVDQRTAYSSNLNWIRERNPDFVAIAGDLVQAGGEQRDWDEFWRQNAHPTDADSSLAGRIPLVPVIGNHEYYSSPHSFSNDIPKEYRQPWSEMAVEKYATYFEVPDNGSPTAGGRYFRLDYGPVVMIGVDVSNNGPNGTLDDTNWQLLGDADAGGGRAPSFAPGSEQYAWLEETLAAAQQERPFVFVIMHYSPYSVGPHGWPAGEGETADPLSGVPARILTPLFMQYGVDAVFAGHDEMWERSVVEGIEVRPDGSTRPHRTHFYDLGTGGDDLRGPEAGLDNPFQQFLVHSDVPEMWQAGTLVDGGKHYGHLEVNVDEVERDVWEAVLTPVYAFPMFDGQQLVRFERRLYDDEVVLVANDDLVTLSSDAEVPSDRDATLSVFPSPASGPVTIRYEAVSAATPRIEVYDTIGRRVRTLDKARLSRHAAEVSWDGSDQSGMDVPGGLYFVVVRTGEATHSRPVVITR